MSTEENKAVARRMIEEVINKGNLALADELFAANVVDHAAPPGFPPGLEGFKMSFTGFHAAFPDLHDHIDDEIAEGDMVVQRTTAHGTMKGEFAGMPPPPERARPGRRFTSAASPAARWWNTGRLLTSWACCNNLGWCHRWGKQVTI